MKNKVTIIGAGMVGSTIAYSLIAQDTVEEIALIDLNEKLVHAQVLDLQHSVPFCSSTAVKVGSYADCADSKVVIISCGAAQKPGQSRIDLVKQNAAIIKAIVPQIFAANPEAVLVMVTNPVDILTRLAVEMYPQYKQRIIGTGTLLDSARLRHLLGRKLHINAQSIHAYIIGEHGDSELPLWSSAAIGNMQLSTCKELSEAEKNEIFDDAKSAAYTIIEGKQATYYAIGAGTETLVRSIIYNEKNVMPVSYYQDGENGVRDVCLSMPAVVGREGIVGTLCLELSADERQALEDSAKKLQDVFTQVD